jgi:hypothetical protein
MKTIKLLNFIYENTAVGHELEVPLSDSQAVGMSKVLLRLGLNPDDVIETQREAGVDAADTLEETLGEAKREKMVVEIEPKAIAMAKEFYALGKENENWYYDATKSLVAGFPDEQERVLFSVLLAATSVQNEIYTNFIEAGLLFNAIMKDATENYDLLMRYIDDSKAHSMDQKKASASDYSQLNIYKQSIEAKVINLGAKFGNIARVLKLYFQNALTVDVVRNMIASSIELQSDMPFDKKSPLIRKLKIANFALTLIDPAFASSKDNWFNVVVDTWMFRVFYPGAGKEKIGKLFNNQVAYANVAKVVSSLAQEAGVSPHVMQAAIWIGIKKQVEGTGANAGAADYLQAIDKLLKDYESFWKDINKETQQLKNVIQRIDVGVEKAALLKNRGDIGRARLGGHREKVKAAKAADLLANPPPPPVAKPAKVAKEKPVKAAKPVKPTATP